MLDLKTSVVKKYSEQKKIMKKKKNKTCLNVLDIFLSHLLDNVKKL